MRPTANRKRNIVSFLAPISSGVDFGDPPLNDRATRRVKIRRPPHRALLAWSARVIESGKEAPPNLQRCLANAVWLRLRQPLGWLKDSLRARSTLTVCATTHSASLMLAERGLHCAGPASADDIPAPPSHRHHPHKPQALCDRVSRCCCAMSESAPDPPEHAARW